MKNLFENLYQETGYIFRLDDIGKVKNESTQSRKATDLT